MSKIDKAVLKVKSEEVLSREEVIELLKEPIDKLAQGAEKIKKHFMGNKFNLCGIVNGKNGNCSEDCSYCAQSIYSKTPVKSYGLRNSESLYKEIKYNERDGIKRTSIVTSGRKLSKEEIEKIAKSYKYISENTDVLLCGSHGLLEYEDFVALKEAGVVRYHCNLESSEAFFANICTTHNYQDRVETILAAQRAGLEICSGGIIGLGESMEDRVDMAFDLRKLNVKSIPINILSPIKGTALENQEALSKEEIRKTFSIFRYINPEAFIRYAAGRGVSGDKGRKIFNSGANAMISGNLLNTPGVNINEDKDLIYDMGFELSI